MKFQFLSWNNCIGRKIKNLGLRGEGVHNHSLLYAGLGQGFPGLAPRIWGKLYHHCSTKNKIQSQVYCHTSSESWRWDSLQVWPQIFAHSSTPHSLQSRYIYILQLSKSGGAEHWKCLGSQFGILSRAGWKSRDNCLLRMTMTKVPDDFGQIYLLAHRRSSWK